MTAAFRTPRDRSPTPERLVTGVRRSVRAAACAMLALAAAAVRAAPAAEPAPPLPPVVSVVDLGLVQQDAFVQCRDGTYSALIDGRSVWTFNDTCLRKPGVAKDQFIDNTLAWTRHLDPSNGLRLKGNLVDQKKVPRRFVPFTAQEAAYTAAHAPNELAIWPGHLVPDPARQRELVFFGVVYRGSGIGFTGVGAGIAVADPSFEHVTRPLQSTDPNAAEQTYLWGPGELAYTSGYVVDGEMLYCYGGQGGAFAQTDVHVARVALADVLDKSRWTYWNGSAWSADPKDTATVYEGGAAGDTIFFDKYLGVYMTIYQPYLSADVFFRVAHHPEGPWSAAGKLFTTVTGTDVSYAARAHPEFAQGHGATQVVSYVKNTGFLAQELPLVAVTFGPLPTK